MANYRALIAGATGIVGLNLASELVSDSEWTVFGLARNPGSHPDVQPVAADLVQLRGGHL